MRLFPFFSVPLPIDLYAEMNTSFNIKEEQTWRNLVMRAVLIVASVGLIVWAMPHDNRSYYHIEKGKPWKYADFTAPFDFPIYKSDEAIQAEKDSLMHDYEPYYQYNANKENEMVKRFEKDYAEGIPGLGPEYIEMISNRLHSLYQQGIMSSAEYSELRTDTARMIRVVNGKQANSVSIMEVYSAKSAYEQLFHDEALALQRPILQKCNLNDYITPNLIYDKERSETSINDLMSSIALASGVVQKGQKIVGRGEIVTDRIYRAMDSFIKENERLHQDDTQNQFALLGQILYVAIIIICFTIYLSLYRRDYLVKSRKIMMAYALITIFSILTAVFVRNTFIHVYILPYAMVPIFIRVFMDSRTAFMAHATMIMICAVMLVHPFEFVVIESIGGLIAISSLRELSQRSQLFKTAIFIALSMMAVNLAFDWMRTDSLSKIDYSIYNYLIINGIALLFAYPLLYLIEKAFGFTSDITLIELSYTNNQLMRKMSEMAGLAMTRATMRARGFRDDQIMGTLQPIVIESHPLGNPHLNYSVVLSNLIVPGLLMLVIMLTTCYSLGNEWKRGRQKYLYDLGKGRIGVILIGKLLPQTVLYTIIFWLIDLIFYSYLQFPCQCGVSRMMLWGFLAVLSSQGFGLLMFEAFPSQMRMAMSASSLLGVMQFSLAGFSFPVSAMDEPFQWLSNIFPLHHYFLIYVNQCLNGYSISYVWTSVVALVAIFLLPQLFSFRLRDAMLYKEYRE